MTQITLKLELDKDANPNLLKKLLGSMKGVVKVSMSKPQTIKNKKTTKEEEMEKWIEDVKWLSSHFDSSTLDMDDERTRYIMRESK